MYININEFNSMLLLVICNIKYNMIWKNAIDSMKFLFSFEKKLRKNKKTSLKQNILLKLLNNNKIILKK